MAAALDEINNAVPWKKARLSAQATIVVNGKQVEHDLVFDYYTVEYLGNDTYRVSGGNARLERRA